MRFGALVRVSTEKQAHRGESLRTQRSQIEAAVKSMEDGSTIEVWYGGQEHATSGPWERQQLELLMTDAQARRFDAVICADATRWSRDNVRSDNRLEQLRESGVRFFVLTKEYDLHSEQDRMFLRFTATSAR